MSQGLLKRVRGFAAQAHRDQKYGDKPYVYHLLYVSTVLSRFGFDDEILQSSAWLHDVVEDTDVTIRDVFTVAGPEVADIVSRVTDKPGENRKARHKNTYPLIRESKKATIVKLGDRIANVENCLLSGNVRLLKMYRKENPYFRKFLWTDHSDLITIWSHLDSLIKKD